MATHPMELKVLSVLRGRDWCDFDTLVSESGLGPDQLRRSLEWLTSKGLAEVKEKASHVYVVATSTPPELLLVRKLKESGGSLPLDALRPNFASDSEFSAALGRARSAGWVVVEGSPAVATLADLAAPGQLEELMKLLSAGKEPPAAYSDMLTDLLRRGIVKRIERKNVMARITQSGLAAQLEQAHDYVERLTPEMLASGAWRGARLRPIDVTAGAPRYYPGRRHPVRDFIREVREAYISMGFTELEGDSIQPAFWNFDALFIPQDHPGREMQDTFYIKGAKATWLQRRGVVARVASTHENGWTTGSRGWGYRWSVEEARRLVLRTHNTVLTVRALSEYGEKEARVFAVSKVYRNENLDYKHLFEFHQMDGIIVGKGLNVRHLMGFLKEFYKKLGMEEVKLWPTYFPYTEPSLQVMGYSSVVKDWIELGGSGVFRPEVTKPMGVDVPVLAWGPGIERLMLLRYGLDDLRELYANDLSWLRRRRAFARSKY